MESEYAFDVLKHRTENPSDNCKFTSPNVIFFLPQCVTFSKSVDMHVFNVTIHKKTDVASTCNII